ncbi:carcinoembryonic antigen-related cell adhesion molecule 20-like [Engraulis encrasicolus]|uniref:carcinoembryonic antigen-related cell adhesion molecule 20-like n=1 Tax=Engraulis encrasicolus TaxID=184585 RepID=UPI002FD333E9
MTLPYLLGVCLGQSQKAVGGSVEFRLTNLPSTTPDTFTWLFGSMAICTAIADTVAISPSYRDRASVDGTTVTLELRNLTLKRVSDPAIMISGSPDPLVAGKSSVSVTCEAKGSITTRKWMKNGGTLSPEPDRVIISEDNRTVSISPVQKEDTGEYTCQVSNPISNVEASATLIVNYGPEAVIIKGEDHEGAAEFKEQ